MSFVDLTQAHPTFLPTQHEQGWGSLGVYLLLCASQTFILTSTGGHPAHPLKGSFGQYLVPR